MERTAVLIGATGLVGAQLLGRLLADDAWHKVVVLGRRACGVAHAKLEEHVIDFATPDSWASLVRGDAAFSALGTTLKAAGSKDAQWAVDYTYQLAFAKAAASNAVPTFVLISSGGASVGSRMFYLRMKGELERDIAALGFVRVCFLRPGMLDGDRAEPRALERVSLAFLRPLSGVLPASLRTYPASVVAEAAITCAQDKPPGVHIVEGSDIFAAV